MSHYSWNDDDTIWVYTGITIITDNLISYEYFKQHFSNTISYFKKAAITVTYEKGTQDAIYVFNYYNKFAIEVFKDNVQVIRVNDSVTIPLAVFIMADYRNQLNKNIDILNPVKYYDSRDHEEYFKTYYDNMKIVSDQNFVSLGVNIKEEFIFQDKWIPKFLKGLARGPDWVDKMDDVLTIIRHAKMFPDDPKSQQSALTLDFNKITLKKTMDDSDIWAYLLFNLYFLEKRYTIVLTSDLIDTKFGFVTEAVMFDIEKLTEFLEVGKSWTIINTSISVESTNYLGDQEWFKALKKDIQNAYDELYADKKSLQDNLLKTAKHIEKQIGLFAKTKNEFHIVAKNWKIDSIKDIISSANPKRRPEIEQRLWWVDGYYHNEAWKTRTYEKKRKVGKL